MFDTLKTVAATSLLALSSNAAFAETKVEFWHSFSGNSGEVLDGIVADFEAANPDINIDAQHIGNYNDIVTKLQAAIPARRAPDAVIMEVTRYGLFADRGVLTDLTDYLEADPLKDELFDFAREVGVYDGKNFIVPFNSSTPVLYVNTAIFADADMEDVPALTTFDEILSAAQQVQAKLGDQGISGIAAPGQFARWGLIMANESDLIDSVSGEILIDAPNTIEAYEWMASLVHEHGVASVDGVTKENNGRDAFLAGKVGMMMNSTGNYRRSKTALGDDLLVLPMPCNKTCAAPIGGAGIGILSTSAPEVKDAAYKFISYAAGAGSNAKWFAGTGYMPINKHTKDQPVAEEALKGEPGITVAIEQLSVARGRPRPPVVTWMRASEYDMWQAMALGQHDVAQTLKDFASQTRAEEARTN
ncbi:carbohydrate ABC transporter substrate-binding protein (CUT1 family) [Primorskyibacter sedentarius]|uniref:Carbohydrate ABC transporter substrate-binding protein (CUT1 family) n=1 Tax=Primorskyibacter sedentarius TaxID=745311 RepID=A0A4R3INV3_9RHOB|nr:ABC transporter substrate-binding protein [Primorskyibacter sedentarius]TCS51605.1 carbohydrate ABC transporter substrate-binding protein (CUT1 family) [Primorskyibacter sedentarius]